MNININQENYDIALDRRNLRIVRILDLEARPEISQIF